ncbi:glycosyltransferase family 9 protein [Desulfohalovibrio reitneri]|uniref:glycosyltransferase family 9 protein n=1 Tax=Desulfohalovibrio reitneri TaxID=1307759 RepID=UPI00068F0C60|nr:glycosyltransferase family 9 protein [Desulfohalovibrio reitneri]
MPPRPPRLPDKPRILVCQLRQIGDVLLSTPAVRMLKKRWPEGTIHFLTEKKCSPVLENNPDIDAIWELDKKALSHFGKELAFSWKVARQNYDLVVDFQQLPRIRWVVAFSAAKVRLSYSPPWYTKSLYTHSACMDPGYAAMAKASVLKPLGLVWEGERPRIHLLPLERAWAGHFHQQHGLTEEHAVITLDPTHRRETRRWPAEHFASMVDMVAEKRPDVRFVLLHGPGEEEAVRPITEGVAHPENLIVPGRVLNLREMAAVIQSARLHVGTCSAPRHMAVAVNTPSLVVHGSTSDAWSFPSEEHQTIASPLPCRPCNENVCPEGHIACLRDLDPEIVADALLGRI